MLRKQVRERREYIYRKSIESRDRSIAEKKRRVKEALNENKVIPAHLRKDALEIQDKLGWDDDGAEGQDVSIKDDEYRWAGVEDPKVMVSTSRKPTDGLKRFAKEIKLMFPNSQRINRGNYDIKQIMRACTANNVTDVILLSESRGVPDGMQICHLPFGPTAYFTLSNIVTRHSIPDVGKMSEAYPNLIFHKFESDLGKRVQNILKYLFPVPKSDSRRIMTFGNNNDNISFRHHIYKKIEGQIELQEVGPRFEMKLYKIIQGTLDTENTADVEWVYRPFMNTTRKRTFLADMETS